MSDDSVRSSVRRYVLDRFMDRDYAPDGKGGLFTIRDPRFDMRSMEIWYQLTAILREIIREGSLT